MHVPTTKELRRFTRSGEILEQRKPEEKDGPLGASRENMVPGGCRRMPLARRGWVHFAAGLPGYERSPTSNGKTSGFGNGRTFPRYQHALEADPFSHG